MKKISIIALLMLPSVTIAQHHAHLVIDPHTGKIRVRINCTPGREVIMAGPPKATDTPQTAELKRVYAQIVNNDVLLRQALQHKIPEYRFTAVYAIAIKKLPKYEELIELLADPHPSVSLAARQALVILTVKYGKREDFGPLARATSEQVAEAQTEWRRWFEARRDNISPRETAK